MCGYVCVCVCVRACVRACVSMRVRAGVCACVNMCTCRVNSSHCKTVNNCWLLRFFSFFLRIFLNNFRAPVDEDGHTERGGEVVDHFYHGCMPVKNLTLITTSMELV